jgi:hypothetical protein
MFGTGRLTATPVGGGAPVAFGALQSVSVDFTGDVKELYGRNQFALDIARGKVKIQCKATVAQIDVNLYNQTFFGQSVTTGQQLVVESEAGTIATAAYTVVNSGANFTQDLGVVRVTTGVPFTRVASGPTVGQYAVSATGVYTFNATDNASAILVSYQYSTVASGQQIVISNVLMGAIPTFQAIMNGSFKGKQISLTLYACVANKITLPLKQDDYAIKEFDFQAQDNGSGQVGLLTATNT